MVHDLQQQVVDVRVGLLDLVEQHDRVRMAGERLREQAALIETDVAGRRPDEPRDGVRLLVLAHVEAYELHPEDPRERPRELRLADAGRAGEEEAALRLGGVAQARAGEPSRT